MKKLLLRITPLIILLLGGGAAHTELMAQQESSSPILVSNKEATYGRQGTMVPLADLLTTLEQNFEATFLFKDEVVRQQQVDTGKIKMGENKGAQLAGILEQVGLTYSQVDEQTYVLLPKETLRTKGDAQAQISGTVTDGQSGETLPGVNILVKGTSTGTSTDAEGTYELTVESLQDTLVVSYIGYQTQQVLIDGRTTIDVAMQSQAISGEEMVVVGYGTQRKSNLTGSVSSIDMGQFEKKTVTQSSQALAGATSGITVTQGSGQPGANQASIRIRGQGTFSGAGNNPLVLIDGIPGSINEVNPSNIESVSVLKDAASAAIYGSRAANGVVLITTKEGQEGELQVSYESYVGMQEPTELPHYVDSWTYAEMRNEARANQGKGPRYTQEEIEKFKAGNNRDKYPNKHHVQDLYNSGNGLQQKHNLTFSGGKQDTRYLFSVGYLSQNGLIAQTNYNRYNARLNLNSDLRDNLKLNVKLYGNRSIQKEPAMIYTVGGNVSGLQAIMRTATSRNATIPGVKSDGTYGVQGGHPVAAAGLAQESFKNENNTNFVSDASLEWNIIKHLQLIGNVSYQNEVGKNDIFGAKFEANPDVIFGPSQVNKIRSNNRELRLEALIKYDKSFGERHNLKLLGGMNQTAHNSDYLSGYRDNFPNNQVHEINAASSTNQQNGGSASTWKLKSFFGRANYSFQEKYLLEGSFRYDGSSRFAEGNRYGFFPSVSAGWRISNEKFFQISWIENLKIRGSYGKLGNQQIGNYPYQRVLPTGQDYPIGGTLQPGMRLTRLPFEDISWETTRIIDGGVDMSLFEDELNITVDYYHKTTSDILYELTTADLLGLSVSPQNGGKVENKGWEFDLKHKNTFGGFSYSISTNFSINQNKVKSLAGIQRDVAKGLFIGSPISSIYGYKTDGLFVDQEDIENYEEQNYDAKPGLPRYRDISGPDGKPDGKVTAAYDRTIIGNRFPKYSYGMGITANYKGFDFYMQLQGQGGIQGQIQGLRLPLFNQGDVEQWHVENRWTKENPKRNAKFTRMDQTYTAPPWNSNLEYWLRDAGFLRLKNIQVGYSIPLNLIKNTFIRHLRVYISGQNMKTFDRYAPGWDPEMETTGYQNSQYYPPTRLWNAGVNLQF